ncbi:MAG: hypothetical protein ACI9F9_001515 [Candidatus Paceibacteria bacterium]|jgi:hypothetical protein
MNLAKWICWTLLSGLALVAAGCSASSDGTVTVGSVVSSLQDLGVDPNGTTTVVTFSQAPGAVNATYFTADGGQTAQTAVLSGAAVTVTWDVRVSPANTISVTGMPGIADGVSTPTTTNAAAPTFTITNTAQNAGIGADTLEVTFAGPRVDETDAEDPTSWTLTVNATALDLTGSALTLNPATQVMTVTLGATANLHSTFTLAATSLVSVADTALSSAPVAGAASGDASSPTLTSVVQNLTADEFGRVVDFTFSEAMSPAFSESSANFAASGSIPATSVSQVTPGLLRVTFNAPMIPGVNTITPSNMMDVHGNTVTPGAQAVTQPSPVVNSYAGNSAVTVTNVGGDYVEATFVQAFDQTSADDLTKWDLVINAVTIDLSLQTVAYDFLNKRLRIDLVDDMVNGQAFTLTGTGVLEVDGQTFSLADASIVSGDVAVPTVTGVLQNRTQDPTGSTLDVSFSEDLIATGVSTTGNWAVTGRTVASVVLLGTPNIARVTVTGGAAVPGIATLDVSGLLDLAGNSLAAVTNHAITSSDSTDPSLVNTNGDAIEGANNDTVTVRFNDDMVQSQVENPAYWTVESPIGTAMDTTGASVSYATATRQATLTFDAATEFFKLGDTYRVSMATMTDIGANTVTTGSLDGSIAFEGNHPYADLVYLESSVNTEVVVRFSEHMDYLTDLYNAGSNVEGVRYVVRDNGGALRGSPNTATLMDSGLGVRLSFGFVISASDTLDVLGCTDLVGNYLYPSLIMALATESATEPALGTQVTPLQAISGESNDLVTVIFDRDLSPWGTENYLNYTVNDGSTNVNLSKADFSFDGSDTVTITLNSATSDSLQAASTYSFTVDGLQTEQGVSMSSSSNVGSLAVTGDTMTPPVIGATSVRLDRATANAVLVFSNEALDPTAAEDEGRWLYNGATLPTTATLLDPTTVRLSFPLNPVAGNNLAFNARDLAGNETGAAAQAILGSESTPPALISVQGTAVAGEGGDYVTVIFDEPVDSSTGLQTSNYTVTNGGTPLNLSSTGAWYDSTLYSMNFFLAAGYEFDSALAIQVTVNNISDYSSNPMPGATALNGIVVGDTTTPPGYLNAFTNFRENAFGLTVDVLFDEAPDQTFITNPFSWSVTGGGAQVVLGVTRIDEDEYRVSLSAALGAGHELEIVAGMPDLAGNLTVAITAVTVTE